MAKPSINQITPFDAGDDFVVKVSYTGNLPYGNRLIIYAADSLSKVYDERIESFQPEHVIPAWTLSNGRSYAMQIQFYDRSGEESQWSDKLFFMTLTSPVYSFDGITNGMTIGTPSILANINYSQEQFEDVRSYNFYIYDSEKILLSSSETMYDYEKISYSYRGLSNQTSYYIRWMGVTDHGIQLDTGYILIHIKFENPNTYARMYVECNTETSSMDYHTNFKLVESSNEEEFEYDNGFIHLENKVLVYDKDYVIPDNATWIIRGKYLFKETTLLRCGNDMYGFELKSYLYDDGILRYKLIVPNGLTNYILYSDELVFEDTDIVTIYIRKIDNVYQLKCFVNYETTEQTNMFFGSTRPGSAAEQYDIWVNTDNTSTVRVTKESLVLNESGIFLTDEEPENVTAYTIWFGDN